MSETAAAFLATAAAEVARTVSKTQIEKARYDYLGAGRTNTPRAVQQISPAVDEETLPDVELNSYINRKELEGGTHVLIVEHKEHLEKVRVPPTPPTPEELAQQREEKRFMAKLWAGTAAVSVAIISVTVVIVERNSRKIQPTV